MKPEPKEMNETFNERYTSNTAHEILTQVPFGSTVRRLLMRDLVMDEIPYVSNSHHGLNIRTVDLSVGNQRSMWVEPRFNQITNVW